MSLPKSDMSARQEPLAERSFVRDALNLFLLPSPVDSSYEQSYAAAVPSKRYYTGINKV